MTLGGGELSNISNKVGNALQEARSLPDITEVGAFFNAASGDMVYSFDFRSIGYDYDQTEQLRIRDANATMGGKLGEYRYTSLPQTGNSSVRDATKSVLNSLPKGTKLETLVDAGTREERTAKLYGFEEVPGSLQRQVYGGYVKTYRRII